MKRSVNLLTIIHLLTVTLSCFTMELPHEKNYPEITSIKNPRQAKYLTNNHIIMSNSKKCSIIDLLTNKKRKIADKPHHSLIVHSKKEKIALLQNNSITLYDITTGNKIWSTTGNKIIACSTFSPVDNHILICYQDSNRESNSIKKCNYATNSSTRGIYKSYITTPVIACHPTLPLICINSTSCLLICNANTFQAKTAIPLKIYPLSYEYSPNGSIIAIRDLLKIYILDHKKMSLSNLPPIHTKKNSIFTHMIFHPNSTVLTTVSDHKIISYWDTKTQQPITEMLPLPEKCLDLSFSPDGIYLLITLTNKCIIVPVPLEVIYILITKENAMIIYWLLKNTVLSLDIIQLITHNILAPYKR